MRKKHRRVGIGRDAATLIFDRFAGDWEIVEYQRNPGAVLFWRAGALGVLRRPLYRTHPQRRGASALRQPAPRAERRSQRS